MSKFVFSCYTCNSDEYKVNWKHGKIKCLNCGKVIDIKIPKHRRYNNE